MWCGNRSIKNKKYVKMKKKDEQINIENKEKKEKVCRGKQTK